MKTLISLCAFAVVVTGTVLFPFSSAQAVTADELRAQIQALLAQLSQLQAQLAKMQGQPAAWCFTFNNNLRFGDNNADVGALRSALSKDGFSGLEAMGGAWGFDENIASAVVGFQQKYADEILAPYGLKYGTGYVGPKTRAKLNSLYGCGAIIRPIPSKVSIASLSPSSGPVGTTVTISGFGFTTTGNTVKFGKGYIGPLNSSEGATLQFMVPSGHGLCPPGEETCGVGMYPPVTPGTYAVFVTNASGTSNSLTFTVTKTPTTQPSVTVLSPSSGPVGTTVMVYGSGFTSTGNSVNFGTGTGAGGRDLPANGGVITFQVPFLISLNCTPFPCGAPSESVGPGNYKVSVTNANGTSNSLVFTVPSEPNSAPVIDSVDGPSHLAVSQEGKWVVRAHDPDSDRLNYYVQWEKGGGTQVNVSLLGTTQQEATFTHIYPNAGVYTITFKVTDSRDSTAFFGKEVTATFEVKVGETSEPSITVLSPNGGEKWEVGKVYSITWRFTGEEKIGETVDIELENSPGYPTTPLKVAKNLYAGLGTYPWVVPSSLINPGDFYKTRIVMSKDIVLPVLSQRADRSDNYFSIVASSTQPL